MSQEIEPRNAAHFKNRSKTNYTRLHSQFKQDIKN